MVKRHNYQLTIFNLCTDKGINVIKKIHNYNLQYGEIRKFKVYSSYFTSVTLGKLRLRANFLCSASLSVPFRLNKQRENQTLPKILSGILQK